MQKLLFISILGLLFSNCNGQNSNMRFAASKGTWNFPITGVVDIDTIGTDCLGMEANSYTIVLTTDLPAEVRALQSGVLLSAREYDAKYAVMIQTRNYFLYYVGLSRPNYNKGDIITQGSVIGKLTKWKDEKNYGLALMLLKDAKTLNINRWFNWKTAFTNGPPAAPAME